MENKNFSIIPNEIIKNLSANDIALFCKLRYYGGFSGQCYASKHRLINELKIGKKALNKSFEILLDRKLIFKGGTKQTMTQGGLQNVQIYDLKGGLKVSKGGAERATSKIDTKKEEKGGLKEPTLTNEEKRSREEEKKNELEMEERKRKKLTEIGVYLKGKFQQEKKRS